MLEEKGKDVGTFLGGKEGKNNIPCVVRLVFRVVIGSITPLYATAHASASASAI